MKKVQRQPKPARGTGVRERRGASGQRTGRSRMRASSPISPIVSASSDGLPSNISLKIPLSVSSTTRVAEMSSAMRRITKMRQAGDSSLSPSLCRQAPSFMRGSLIRFRCFDIVHRGRRENASAAATASVPRSTASMSVHSLLGSQSSVRKGLFTARLNSRGDLLQCTRQQRVARECSEGS